MRKAWKGYLSKDTRMPFTSLKQTIEILSYFLKFKINYTLSLENYVNIRKVTYNIEIQ